MKLVDPKGAPLAQGISGLTVRDYFAAAVLPAVFTSIVEAVAKGTDPNVVIQIVAETAGAMADGMLAERSKIGGALQ